jgi:cytochrome c-type biogenesis protein CcmE
MSRILPHLPEVLMTHRTVKIGVTAVALVAAFVALLWTTLRDDTEYFKNIDEVMVERPAWEGKPLQLHGYVVPGSILRRPGSLDYRFKVQNNPPRSSGSGPAVEVLYTGIVPDTFKPEAEVVLRGRLAADGFHTAPDGVVAKCPSKYEPSSKPSVNRESRFAG